MTTQPETTAQQHSHFWTITLQTHPRSTSQRTATYRMSTFHGTITPAPGSTRHDTFVHLRDIAAKQIGTYPDEVYVLHFALEPNQL